MIGSSVKNKLENISSIVHILLKKERQYQNKKQKLIQVSTSSLEATIKWYAKMLSDHERY